MDGFYIEEDGDVTIHTITNSSEQAIDTWYAELACLIEMTPSELPFRVLLDVSAKHVSFTQYARQKSLQVSGRRGPRPRNFPRVRSTQSMMASGCLIDAFKIA